MPDGLEALDELARWSDWVPIGDAAVLAPRAPGVYIAREGNHGPLVYVGMAGERAGSGSAQGIRGRLRAYSTGKGLVSGLGEAVLDRALADAVWLTERLAEVRDGRPMRAKQWGSAAFERANLHVRWAVTPDRTSALALERSCIASLDGVELWNRHQ